jgi:hypothetical protein
MSSEDTRQLDRWTSGSPKIRCRTVRIAEQDPFMGRHFVDEDGISPTAMAEVLMRIVEEDLAGGARLLA